MEESAAELAAAADTIKSSSYPGDGGGLAAAEQAAGAVAAGAEGQEEACEAPGSGGKPGRMRKLMRHIRKLSGGTDADWAAASYKQAPGHVLKSSVSSLNLGY